MRDYYLLVGRQIMSGIVPVETDGPVHSLTAATLLVNVPDTRV